jgi:cytochrome c-type biogenesis protein CcsB
MGVLLIIFAVSMAVATFIGNDYGLSAAFNFVYDTRWFELILLLLVINMAGQIITMKLYRRAKLTVFLFHASFIIIIAGAGITRYTGWEGTMHIREGVTENRCLSVERYLGYSLYGSDGALIADHSGKYSMTTVSADNYRKKFTAAGDDYEIVLARIMQNVSEVIVDDAVGVPMVSLLVSDEMRGREELILRMGDIKTVHGISVGFISADKPDIAITLDSGVFSMSSVYPAEEMNMMTGEKRSVEAGELMPLQKMKVTDIRNVRIVPQEMSASATTRLMPIGKGNEGMGKNVFVFHVFSNDETTSLHLWESDPSDHASASAVVNNKTLRITYGPEIRVLPFSLKLDEFILEKYPGSESPSGYRSEITLTDSENDLVKPFSIFMNNVLKYRGYRFYQASYDTDEKGTILSVNKDMAGMIVTYTGYAFMIIFIILSLINRKSVFQRIEAGNWNSPLRKTVAAVIFMIIITGFNSVSAQKLIPDRDCAEEFGKVLVQDQRGRTKPLITLSSDIMRKVTRENRFEGLTPMQFFLGIYIDFYNWQSVPLIRVTNKELQRTIGIRGNRASFSDLVSAGGGGTYKLIHEVNRAYSRAPAERTRFDKEVMKVDERVNIVYMIYTGAFLKIFPLRDESHSWGPPMEALRIAVSREDSAYVGNIIPSLTEALQTRNLAAVKKISASLTEYQRSFTEYNLPSEAKIKAEAVYYKMKIFERLFPFYFTIGLIMLIILIIMVILGRRQSPWVIRIPGILLFSGFLLHTFGLALRWYISGHSPMSNGYESMIFISWVTLLAGFIFTRRSVFTLPATGLLSAFALLVAHLSFMDPEITNLVPVLQSYWLTLHVSVITGSYGFLGLGAVLGIINMILMIVINRRNLNHLSDNIDDLTVICYKSLTIGLYLLTIGTFLGAVWANESWGRYWGWDPKETWSLITIVVYTLVIHSRLIRPMKDIFTFNLLSVFAFFSVLMTYFGVNYYLSGLHSYAGGDAVNVPVFVYITVLALIAVSVTANLRYRKFEEGS